jgi:quinol monooxygenase YgiN
MISTVAIITAKPGRGDEAEAMLRSLAEASQGDDGCLLYSLQRGLQDRDVFVTVEKWESPEHLQAHLVGPSVATAMTTGADVLAGAPVVVPAEFLTVGDPARSTY